MLAVFYAGTGGMQFSAVAQNRAARISDRLRELIEAKELKFFLMKKSGLKKDFPSMYNWLSGKYIPNVYNLVRLAKLLDCSVDYLLGRE